MILTLLNIINYSNVTMLSILLFCSGGCFSAVGNNHKGRQPLNLHNRYCKDVSYTFVYAFHIVMETIKFFFQTYLYILELTS